MTRRRRLLQSEFLKTEAGAGLILALAAMAGVIAANSPLAPAYFGLLHTEVPVQIGGWAETHDVLDWIKEGLMAIFFFAVGLEIKFEALRGELSTPKRLALPLIAAFGGMLVPALIYMAVNLGPGGHVQGWPIPVATDIVFALAALAAVGARAPPSLRAFLLALAVVDDLGAVLLIAFMFSEGLDLAMLAGAGAVLAVMVLMARRRKTPTFLYAVGATAVWAFAMKSGVSATVGAVAAALTVPIAAPGPGRQGLVHDMTEELRPYVSFIILPIFAFAASGFSVAQLTLQDLTSPVAVGVFLGLLIGKPVGVFAAARLADALKVAHRPAGASWTQVFGASALCGVGFTMSLFLASLAFDETSPFSAAARIGVIGGSICATALGVFLLLRAPAPVGAGSERH